MQVECVLTEEDWIRFNEHIWRSSPSLQRGYRRAFLLGPVLGLAVVVNLELRSPYLIALVLLGTSLGFFLFYRGFHRRSRGRQFARLIRERAPKSNLGRHTISVSAAGLHESTEYGESRVRWAGVANVEETEDHVFIYTGAATAHIVPKRCFPSAAAAESFLGQVRSFWSGPEANEAGSAPH